MGDSSRFTRKGSKQLCQICNKGPTADGKISMHSLPAWRLIRTLWLDGLHKNKDDLDESICVCSRHFSRCDYRVKNGKRELQLRPGAVPRYHLNGRQRAKEEVHRGETPPKQNPLPKGDVLEALRQLRKLTSTLEDEPKHPAYPIHAKHELTPDQISDDEAMQRQALSEPMQHTHSSIDLYALSCKNSQHNLKKPSNHRVRNIREKCPKRARKTSVSPKNAKKKITIQSLRLKICQLEKTIKTLRYKRCH